MVQSVSIENLSIPETTYNLEVSDFHTYYVTESNVLVHNTCKRAAMRSAKRSENIPTNQKPDKITIEKAVRGENGHFYRPVTYKFGDKFIRNDFGGHKFFDGSTMGRHFNAGRIVEGNYVGNKLHFFY